MQRDSNTGSLVLNEGQNDQMCSAKKSIIAELKLL